jgi:excisionase family DNA binding protein
MRTSPSNFEFPHQEPSLRTAEVARALGVSARAIRTWADEGKIACYRTFGGHRLFTTSEVRRVLASWGGEPSSDLNAEKQESDVVHG